MPAWCNNPACDCSTLTTADGNAQCAVHILATQGLAAWESGTSPLRAPGMRFPLDHFSCSNTRDYSEVRKSLP